MSHILNETVISIKAAAAQFPGRGPGKKLAFSTIWRWIFTGVRAADGQVVRLEAARLGARWVTSREAILRFSARLTQSTEDEPPAIRTPAARKRDSDCAAKALKDMGI